MNKKIYLLRHGEIETGKERRYIGTTDLPLNNNGVAQINRISSCFSKLKLEKVYCSPLIRCLQTADIILSNQRDKLIISKDLMEINMGQWENKTMETIKHDFPQLYESRGKNMADFVPPEGESFRQLQHRVFPGFTKIIEETSESAMIIAHAGVNRVILTTLLGMPLEELFKLEQPYGCINVLAFQENRFDGVIEFG